MGIEPIGRAVHRGLARTLGPAYWALQSRFGVHARLARRFIRGHGLIVSGGPFAGMRYTQRAAVGRIVAKLVGSYESELHAPLEDLLRADPLRVVNIGSAEGYYAVGIARRAPRARVDAFEADPARRALCEELARENGVADRIVLHGSCDAGTLGRLPEPASLVVCDCEGLEGEILRPDLVPWLRTASLLVELHDGFVPGTTSALTARFAATHDLRLISEEPRDPARYQALAGFTESEAREALDEYRRDREGRPLAMQWAVFTPRHA
jgi:hypothetical protein